MTAALEKWLALQKKALTKELLKMFSIKFNENLTLAERDTGSSPPFRTCGKIPISSNVKSYSAMNRTSTIMWTHHVYLTGLFVSVMLQLKIEGEEERRRDRVACVTHYVLFVRVRGQELLIGKLL